MIEAMLREADAQANTRNEELLTRLLSRIRSAPLDCARCHLMLQYVLLKLTAHRIKKRMARTSEWEAPVVGLFISMNACLGEAQEKRAEASATPCTCGGKTLNSFQRRRFKIYDNRQKEEDNIFFHCS